MYKDNIDEKIIGYLKEDSRESFVDIGKKLKLSESAVRRRVKNLVGNGTIKKFTLELGEENATSAIVLVSVDSATDTSKVSLKLAKLEGVKVEVEQNPADHSLNLLDCPLNRSIAFAALDWGCFHQGFPVVPIFDNVSH